MKILANHKAVSPPERQRVTLRFWPDELDKMDYWVEKSGCESRNEFLSMCMERYISMESGNYQLPTLEAARLNQLIEAQQAMSQNLKSLETIVITGFDSLVRLTRGDNYLLEQDASDME